MNTIYFNWFKRLFWVASGIFIVLTIMSIYSASGLKFDSGIEGFNYIFTDVMKVPFGFIIGAAPLLGILLLLHRSEQTEKQISETVKHNQANNYFMHKKQLDDICSRLHEKYEVSINTGKLYRSLFPNNSPESTSLNYILSHDDLMSLLFPASIVRRFQLSDDEKILHFTGMSIGHKLKAVEYIGEQLHILESLSGWKLPLHQQTQTLIEELCI